MLVFPQTFNYRLIISSLAIALVIVGSYSLYNSNELEIYKTSIKQEKKLLVNELSEMITRYDEVENENTSINEKLEVSEAKIEGVLDSVQTLKVDEKLLTVYKSKIKTLQEEKEVVSHLVEDLQHENQELSNKSKQVEAKLVGTQKLTNNLKQQNKGLEDTNASLSNKIESASHLELEDLTAKAVKRITNKRIVETKDSKRAKKFFVEFMISKNKFAEEGAKDLYIQILNPSNNVVADKGAANFGKQSLIFSKKIEIYYKNEDVKIEEIIFTDKDEPLTKGIYFVSIFNDDKRLGSTSITLK